MPNVRMTSAQMKAKAKAAAAKNKAKSKKGSPVEMNRYDKDMMHERELIYDTKGQLHGADEAYKKGDKGKKKEMIHDRELIHDAKRDIWNEDKEKWQHEGSPARMSDELSYGGPVIDQMGNALSHMGAHKVLKHMKSKI